MNEKIVVYNNYQLKLIGLKETMVNAEETDKVLVVNEFGGMILEYIKEKKKVREEDIINHFYKKFDVAYEDIKNDIMLFISNMQDNGYILRL